MEIILFIANVTSLQSHDHDTINLVYATIAIAIITAIGIGITSWLTRDSLNETRKSNELLRMDIYARVKPLLRIHNTGHEPVDLHNSNINHDIVSYHPNLRNEGGTEASNLRINFKVMDREIDLEEIVRQENEIKKQSIPYDASILPNGVAVLNAVNLPRIDKKISTVLWINYKFLDDVEHLIIFNIISDGTGNYQRGTEVKHYTISDIKRVRKEMKIKDKGAPT